MKKITIKQAKRVANQLELNLDVYPINEWKYAMQVELEHGTALGQKTNVTKDNLFKTGQIALAHIIEFPDYYRRLKKMEEKAKKDWKGIKRPNIFI